METTQYPNDLAAAYAASVDREREAWQALHAQAPGTPGRAKAWEAWSEAISRTNHAWRELSAGRVGGLAHHRGATGARQQHAGA